MDADVIVVGGGLAGLVAACELIDAGKRVILLDQEGEQSLGGQAFWSFGGLMFVDSPEQRRMRIRDSHDLALQDWMGSAGFDREEDHWPRKWAEAYVALRRRREARLAAWPGRALVPDRRLGRARRLSRHRARQLGAALPCHLGHGAGAHRAVRQARARGREGGPRVAALPPPRERADAPAAARSTACAGEVLEPSSVERGARQLAQGGGRLRAQGAGGDRHLGRHRRQPRAGARELAQAAGRAAQAHAVRRARPRRRAHARHRRRRPAATSSTRDRMWHYTEGITNFAPIWSRARHPHPAGPLVAVDRRHGQAPAGAAVPGLRHARHAGAPAARPATTTPGSC